MAPDVQPAAHAPEQSPVHPVVAEVPDDLVSEVAGRVLAGNAATGTSTPAIAGRS